MRPILLHLVLFAALGATTLAAEKPKRPVLRDLLLSLLEEDLAPSKPSVTAAEDTTNDADAAAELMARHDRHRVQLKRLLDNVGWPTSELVGEDGEQAVLELLQAECTDTPLLQRGLHLLNAAVARGAGSKVDLARLVDASRVGQGRLQLYGTQYSQALDGRLVRFPIEDLDRVDERRKLAGLLSLGEQDAMVLGTPAPIKIALGGKRSVSAWWQAHIEMKSRLKLGELVLNGIQAAKGLNTLGAVRLGMIYVHSRDDARAPCGERESPAASGVKTSKVDTSSQ